MEVRVDPAETASNPSRSTPPRVPQSIRRTSNLDMSYDHDDRRTMWIRSRARDLLTGATRTARVLGEARLDVRTGLNRVVEEIRADPPRAGLEHLVGQRGGGGFRKQIDRAAPGDREAGTLLYYLLDDVPAATLISGYVWSRYGADGRPRARLPASVERPTPHLPARGPMENICSGWRTGGTAMRMMAAGRPPIGSTVEAPDLLAPEDPLAWHELDELPLASMRRRRRVDVIVGDAVTIDAMFRDSCRTPDGSEVVVHEYTLGATVDPATMTITDIRAEPRVLPFSECPSAADQAPTLVGHRLAGLRTTVLESLSGVDCCTHLNDALRALAEVPVLLGQLVTAG
jgi:hypothetical protein